VTSGPTLGGTFVDKVDPTMLGVSYYLAVVNVPAMIVVHILIFMHLVSRIKDPLNLFGVSPGARVGDASNERKHSH
jgi:hypothetical protein